MNLEKDRARPVGRSPVGVGQRPFCKRSSLHSESGLTGALFVCAFAADSEIIAERSPAQGTRPGLLPEQVPTGRTTVELVGGKRAATAADRLNQRNLLGQVPSGETRPAQ